MAVIHCTKETFEREIRTSEKPVLIDFFATWCGPCRMVAPIIEEIAQENDRITVCKIDVDSEPELAQAFGVTSIPTLVVLKNGKPVKEAVGARSKEAILDMLKA